MTVALIMQGRHAALFWLARVWSRFLAMGWLASNLTLLLKSIWASWSVQGQPLTARSTRFLSLISVCCAASLTLVCCTTGRRVPRTSHHQPCPRSFLRLIW